MSPEMSPAAAKPAPKPKPMTAKEQRQELERIAADYYKKGANK